MSADLAVLDIQIRTKQLEDAVKKLEEMESAGKKAERSTKSLAASQDGLARSLKSVAVQAAGYLGAFKVAGLLKDSALLAARYETLGVTMETAGKNAGYSASQMQQFEKALQDSGIAMIEAREVLTRMAAAHMDLADASKLSRAAQDLAVAGGINSSQAFERLTYAIQSGQTEMLRTLGLNVQFDSAYKEMAAQLGKTTEALSSQEKMQARVNVVLQGASGYAGLYEKAMGTAGKQITSFSRYWSDMQVELGKSQLPAVTEMVELLKEKIEEFSRYIQKPEVQKALSGIGETAVNTVESLLKIGEHIGPIFKNVLDGWNSLPPIIQEFGLIGALAGGRQAKVILFMGADLIGRQRKMVEGLKLVEAGVLDLAQLKGMSLEEMDKRYKEFEAFQNAGYVVRATVPTRPDSAPSPGPAPAPNGGSGGKADDSAAKRIASDQLKVQEWLASERIGLIKDEYAQRIAEINRETDKQREAAHGNVALLEQIGQVEAQKVAEVEADKLKARQEAQKEYQRLLMTDTQREISELRDKHAEQLRIAEEHGFDLQALRLQQEIELTDLLADQEEQRVRNSKDAIDGMRLAFKDYADSASNMALQMGSVVTNSLQGMEDALVGFVTTGKLEFSSLTQSIIADMARIAIRQSITGPLTDWMGSLFNAHGNAFGSDGLIPFARGGAFTNSIVTQPTLFPFAKGTGLMGEAGPEAIMPLTRTSGGDLGVRADRVGGGTPSVTVNVINESGQQIGTQDVDVRFDGEGWVINAWIRGVRENRNGVRDFLRGGGAN